MIVKNRSGSTATQNYMYEKVKPDGLTIVYGPWNPVGQITRNRALRVRYDKVALIGGGGSTRITWGNKEAIPAPRELVKASKKRVLNYGGNRVTSNITLVTRLGLDVLGVNYKVTFGYTAPARLVAVPQNEIQLATGSINNWIPFIEPSIKKHGKALALFYYPRMADDGSFVRSKDTKDILMYLDVYKAIHGRDLPPPSPEWDVMKWLLRMGTLSQTMWAPPGTAKGALDDLRKGFWGTVKSKEYIDLYYSRYGAPLEFTSFETVSKLVNSIEDTDQNTRDFLKAYIVKGKTFKKIKRKKKKKRN